MTNTALDGNNRNLNLQRASSWRNWICGPSMILVLLSGITLFIGACTSSATPSPPTELPTAEATALPSPTGTTSAAEAVHTPESESDNHCVGCHQDQQQLVDTADPEPPEKPESKGEG